MTIKICPCCKFPQTTKTLKKIGRDEIGLYFNCKCGSTLLLRCKDWQNVWKKVGKVA